MKKLLLVLLVTAFMATPALAEHGDDHMHHHGKDMMKKEMKHDGEHFEKMKAKKLEGIKKHISALEKKHDCISSAADKEALKACKAEYKAFKKAKKEEWQKKKGEWKEKRKEWKEKKHEMKDMYKKDME